MGIKSPCPVCYREISATINGKVVSLDSYWISDHEITNKEYNDFLGLAKSVGIWSIPLSLSNIQYLYNNGVSLSYSQL